MDYKKIIKSRSLRLKILRFLSFVPDKAMIKIQYKLKTGNKLNLKNPRRFTEKLQWYKLYYKNPLMIRCVDKGDVRKYVAKCGLKDILIPSYGIYNSFNEINWDKLPSKFVVKDTLGGGGNSVIIVKDKEEINFIEIKKKIESWTKTNSHIPDAGREWPYYSGKKHRIIIEKYLDSDPEEGGLIDYKFFCFNGNVKYVYGIADRVVGKGAGFGIFDRNFKLLKYGRVDEKPLTRTLMKPENYEDMIAVAERLSKPFLHARIDLYDQNNKIQFGEITFFDGSGYMKFEPDEFDYILGKGFELKPYLARKSNKISDINYNIGK